MSLIADPIVLSEVIATIYDAAIDPSKWLVALEKACRFVGGEQVALYWQGTAGDGLDVLHIWNQDPQFTRMYQSTFAALNPLFPAMFFQEVGAVHTSTDLVPDDEMRETRFFNEWIAPQGLTDALAAVLERDAARVAVISMPSGASVISDEARDRFALLVPHFQRAVAIGRLFVKEKAEKALLAGALDLVGEGVFLLTADARLVFANASGRRMIHDGRLVEERGGRLRAVRMEADRALHECLRVIKAGAPTEAQGTTFPLEDAPSALWAGHLLPLADGARLVIGETHRAAAALFVRYSRFADPTPLEALAKKCGLTASEVRVVDATLRVTGLDAMAGSLGVSKATVKTHLNRIYRKCSARNQSELIKLVAGLGPS